MRTPHIVRFTQEDGALARAPEASHVTVSWRLEDDGTMLWITFLRETT
jgi:hypothetical protein